MIHSITLAFNSTVYQLSEYLQTYLEPIAPYLEDVKHFILDLELLDEFQWKVCKILLFIISINFILIGVSWNTYGKKISEKFMQPSSSSLLIEELKNSISELKLPKEHSPRI